MVQKIIYKTKDYCKVKFTLNPENAETVEVIGLNDNWNDPLVMRKRKDGQFIAEINLPKGSEHEFKYLINNTIWLNEEDADSEKPNFFGGVNSVITI